MTNATATIRDRQGTKTCSENDRQVHPTTLQTIPQPQKWTRPAGGTTDGPAVTTPTPPSQSHPGAKTRPSSPRLLLSPTQTDRLLTRLDLLQPADAELLRMVYQTGQPVSAIARLLHIPVTTLRRRIGHLTRRVLHPAFAMLHHPLTRLSPPMRTVGEEVFLHGSTMQAAARAAGVPYGQARTLTRMLSTLAEEWARTPRGTAGNLNGEAA